MTTSIDIYLGAPLEIESEQLFLTQFCLDLRERKKSALIFGNFFPLQKPQQLDFFIVTEGAACLVELKNYTAPVVGGLNGFWSLVQPDSGLSCLGKNPYVQALNGKYALSDEMHTFALRRTGTPTPDQRKKFYTQFASTVCIYPSLLPGSRVPSDHKVRVVGYAELLQMLATGPTPGWSMDNWREFAMHLGLSRIVGEIERVPDDIQAARKAVDGYITRFVEYHTRDLPPLVPTRFSVGGAEVGPAAVADAIARGRHIQLVGQSGGGKSLFARHDAAAAAGGGRVTILASAREYGGRLSTLLDRSVAPFHADTAQSLFNAAERIGVRVTLVIDGFNECPSRHHDTLLKDLQSLYLRRPMPIIFTTQEEVTVGGPLAAGVFNLLPLTDEERRSIIQAYHPAPLSAAEISLCSVCSTPYELSLAAACADEAGRIDSPAALFDSYVRRRCSRTSKPALTRSVLGHFAARMGEVLAGSLPMADVWRLGQEVIDQECGPTSLLDEILLCGLLEVRQGRCAFRHEMLEQFFHAESLLRSRADWDRLLLTPRCRPLARFVLSFLTDADSVERCLAALADSQLIGSCLDGVCGRLAQDVAKDTCRRALMAATSALDVIDVVIPEGDAWGHLEVSGGPAWSSFDRAILTGIGRHVSRGLFLEDVFSLSRDTDQRCRALLADRAGGQLSRIQEARLFAALYAFLPQNEGRTLPAAVVYHAAHFGLDERPGIQARLLRLAMPLEDRTPAELSWLCQLLPQCPEAPPDILPELLAVCWRTGIYHLRLEALRLAEGFRSRLEGDLLQRVTSFLAGLYSKNLMLSTAIIEALCVYGMVESPVAADEVKAEIADILVKPDDPEAQLRANLVVGRIFEDVFQDFYYTAIEALPRSERVRLFTMASLGAADYCWDTAFALRELIRLNDQSALPAFRRWAVGPNPDAVMYQDSVARFVWAIVGLAQHTSSPPNADWAITECDRAWATLGEIVFWSFRPGLTPTQLQSVAAPAWLRLLTELSFEAVGPLHELQSTHSYGMQEYYPIRKIISGFPSEVKRLMEFAVSNRHYPERFGRHFRFDTSVADFAASILGDVGDSGTVRLLAPLADDLKIGASVVEAVRRIRERIG